jgi:hypothetical protein
MSEILSSKIPWVHPGNGVRFANVVRFGRKVVYHLAASRNVRGFRMKGVLASFQVELFVGALSVLKLSDLKLTRVGFKIAKENRTLARGG